MSESDRIRVMVVDDHEIVRGGIRFLLLAFDDIELVGEARGGEEALALCEEAQPDVVLMDMVMPGMDGVEATRTLCPPKSFKARRCISQQTRPTWRRSSVTSGERKGAWPRLARERYFPACLRGACRTHSLPSPQAG